LELLRISAQHCPWCGEPIELTLDCSYGEHVYAEDCTVCCAPMLVSVSFPAGPTGDPIVELRREND
jgi:hypothetical protein